ncbi:MAG: DUF378 domain-containing protein [Candidatus Daviesbacteria bacterium]|nr:DUF378 domain-containing protein [Candidatus Daviesbacteria bacterium]
MKIVSQVAGILVLVGALNWGLVGLLNTNLVTLVFGEGTMLTSVVYDLVGLSALLVAYNMYVKKA